MDEKNSQMDDPECNQLIETTEPCRKTGFEMNGDVGLSCFRGVINALFIEVSVVFVCRILYKLFWG